MLRTHFVRCYLLLGHPRCCSASIHQSNHHALVLLFRPFLYPCLCPGSCAGSASSGCRRSTHSGCDSSRPWEVQIRRLSKREELLRNWHAVQGIITKYCKSLCIRRTPILGAKERKKKVCLIHRDLR